MFSLLLAPYMTRSLPAIPTSQSEAEVLNKKLVDIQYRHYVEKYNLDPDLCPKEAMIELAKRLDELKKERSLSGESTRLCKLTPDAFSQLKEMLRIRMDETCETICNCQECTDMKRTK